MMSYFQPSLRMFVNRGVGILVSKIGRRCIRVGSRDYGREWVEEDGKRKKYSMQWVHEVYYSGYYQLGAQYIYNTMNLASFLHASPGFVRHPLVFSYTSMTSRTGCKLVVHGSLRRGALRARTGKKGRCNATRKRQTVCYLHTDVLHAHAVTSTVCGCRLAGWLPFPFSPRLQPVSSRVQTCPPPMFACWSYRHRPSTLTARHSSSPSLHIVLPRTYKGGSLKFPRSEPTSSFPFLFNPQPTIFVGLLLSPRFLCHSDLSREPRHATVIASVNIMPSFSLRAVRINTQYPSCARPFSDFLFYFPSLCSWLDVTIAIFARHARCFVDKGDKSHKREYIFNTGGTTSGSCLRPPTDAKTLLSRFPFAFSWLDPTSGWSWSESWSARRTSPLCLVYSKLHPLQWVGNSLVASKASNAARFAAILYNAVF